MINKKGEGKYAELDGLRGVAITAVFMLHYVGIDGSSRLFHTIGQVIRSGWLGVDLFFVLSGFLITRILLASRGGDHYFRNFFARRTLRIFPLYYAVLTVIFVVLPLFTDVRALTGAVDFQGWFWLYGTNIVLAKWGHGPFAGKIWTLHFWTLAVEEQFYLVWPLVIFLLSGRKMVRLCVVMLLVCPVLRLIATLAGVSPTDLYVLLPFRLDPLVAGALIALLLAAPSPWLKARHFKVTACLFGASLITLFIIRGGFENLDPFVQVIGFSLSAGLFASTIGMLVTGDPASLIARSLRNGAFRWLGRYSYGIYVFNFMLVPVFQEYLSTTALVARGLPYPIAGIARLAVVVTINLLLAALSFNLFEKQFLKLKIFFPSGRDARPGASVPQIDNGFDLLDLREVKTLN